MSSTNAHMREAYAVLNLSANASIAEIKQAYRRLLSQYHPDKLAGRGMPDEAIRNAVQKTCEITCAYDKLRRALGF